MPVSLSTQRPAPVHPDVLAAYPALSGQLLSREQALRLAALPGQDVLDLVSLAHKVRTQFAPDTHACTIVNAKSGACSEDCKFCAQSSYHTAQIETYPLITREAILAAAAQAQANGVRAFGIVTSGTGYARVCPEFQRILDAIAAIHDQWPDLGVCASLGNLSAETVSALAQANLDHYNLNLQVAPRRYGELVSTTHSVETRIHTLRLLRAANIRTCAGGIIGLGETMADRVELALALRDLKVDVIPLNVLIPIPGTALESRPGVSVSEIAKTFALFRLIHPHKIIKFAAGRETKMKDFQGLLMLAGANGLLTGGYLTTRGRDTSEDQALLEELKSFK